MYNAQHGKREAERGAAPRRATQTTRSAKPVAGNVSSHTGLGRHDWVTGFHPLVHLLLASSSASASLLEHAPGYGYAFPRFLPFFSSCNPLPQQCRCSSAATFFFFSFFACCSSRWLGFIADAKRSCQCTTHPLVQPQWACRHHHHLLGGLASALAAGYLFYSVTTTIPDVSLTSCPPTKP